MRKKKMRSFILLFSVAFTCFLSQGPVQSQQKSVIAKHAAVVSVDEFASKVGVAIMKKGGNAVDAAVATAFALAVTYPQAGNIGGGGFMLIRMNNGETVAIDYREKAPLRSHADMFLLPDGSLDTVSSNIGYLVAGIPGTVRGMDLAWKKYGKLPWVDLLMPAVELAERGFALNPEFAAYLEFNRDYLSRFDETKRIFFKANGESYKAGELFIQKELARTLRMIADNGADAFYTGPLADAMLAEVTKNGGIWTKKDLEEYQAIIREPVRGTYRGYDIIGMPPPSSGGIVLTEMLNILENFDLKKNETESQHLMVETMRFGFLDRIKYLGDADFVEVPTGRLLSKDYSRALSEKIDRNKAASSEELGDAASMINESTETTHFSVIDPEGNAVSNTYTLEEWFGSGAVIKGLGFLLNNEMHDFNIEPDVKKFKTEIHNPNLIEPGKRMLSSMTPTILLRDGKPVLITGSPGGKTIINTVLQIIVGVVDLQLTLREAVDRPRLSHTWKPDRITIEKGRWDDKTLRILRSKGHKLAEVEFLGDAHSILIDPSRGLIYGEADTRRYGWAEGY